MPLLAGTLLEVDRLRLALLGYHRDLLALLAGYVDYRVGCLQVHVQRCCVLGLRQLLASRVASHLLHLPERARRARVVLGGRC